MSRTRREHGASTSPTRSRRGTMPAVVGALALIILGVATFHIGNAQLEAARNNRLDDRLGLVSRFSLAGERMYDPQALIEQAADLTFSPDHPEVAENLLTYFILNPTSDPYVEVAVVDADGSLVASRPADTDVSRYVLGDAVTDALADGAGLSPVFKLDGQWVWANTIQLGGDPDRPGGDKGWGALVLVEALDGRWLQNLYADLGSLGRGDGGLTLVDSRGVAAASWNPALLGQPVITPDERARVTREVSTWTTDNDGEPTINIAVQRGSSVGSSALIFQQSEAAFYGDLDAAHLHRNRLTYLALIGSMLALLIFTVARQRTFQRAERRASLILNATDDIIAQVDHDGRITSISSGVENLLGHDPADWIARRVEELAGAEHRTRVTEAVEGARRDGIARELSIGIDDIDGATRWFDLTVTDRRDYRHVGGLIVTLTYVGERKELEEELAFRARHDQLTGLLNRAGFEAALPAALAHDTLYVAAVIDLDRFKPLNDRLGHAAGDEALRGVARAIGDVVDGRGLAARLGGDEFAFVIPVEDSSEGPTAAHKILDGIEAISPTGDDHTDLSASIGVVEVAGPVINPVMMLREADAAMYRAKKAGGSQVVVGGVVLPTDDSDSEPTVATAGWATDIDDGGIPATALSSEAVRPPDTPRQRLLRLAPVAVTAAVVLGMLAVIAFLGARAQDEAEESRLDERRQLIAAVGNFTAAATGPERLMPIAAATPWDPADPLPTLAVLDQWSSAPALGNSAAAWLVDRSGNTLASSSPDRTVPTAATVDHDGWSRVLSGIAHIPPLAEGDDDMLRFWWNLPIVRDGTVEEILVISAALDDVSWSEVLDLLGSLGSRPGGAVVVDSNGRVASSWNPDEIGEVPLDPKLLAPASTTHELVDGPGDRVTLVERIADPYSERYILWQKRPSDLYGDLHEGQRSMEFLRAAVVVCTLIGVAWLYRKRERLMRRHEGRLDALLRHSSTVVLVTNRDGLIDYASSALTRYTGRPASESTGSTLAQALGRAAAERVEICADLSAGDRVEIHRVPMTDQTEVPRVCDVVIQPMFDRPEIGGCLITIRDHTDRQLLEDRLSFAAGRDPLTGLVNRAAFAAELEKLQEDRRSDGSSYAVIFIDLDHFKPINDQYGHAVGDQVLIELSRRLESAVRSEDMVARYGGDEFTVLIRACDRPHAEATTERLLAAVKRPIQVDDEIEVQVGASAGVVLGQPGSTSGGRVLRDADHAMYEAKKSGRGQWVLANA